MSKLTKNEKFTDMISQLKQENSRLQYPAEVDWLTGIYNRGAIEHRVDEWLKSGNPGSMIVFDLDYFKQVNDRYGHIAGDQLLQHIGKVLSKMFPQNSFVGRVGGDEFVIFLLSAYSEKEMDERCVRIQERFQEVRLQNKIIVKLSMSVAWAKGREDDNYKSVFDRIDQKIVEHKSIRNMRNTRRYKGNKMELEAIRQDLHLIAREMEEDESNSGACCQDYETFKFLYQLELRRMKRRKKEVYLILFTLLDKSNDFLELEQRDLEMELLGKEIQENLRQGDVFTQYSSSQYLVMVPDADAVGAEIIAERIRTAYFGYHLGRTDHLMLHKSYPLHPIE